MSEAEQKLKQSLQEAMSNIFDKKILDNFIPDRGIREENLTSLKDYKAAKIARIIIK